MASPLAHVGATILCAHGATVNVTPSNTRVLVGKQPVATIADVCLVAGCPLTSPAGSPIPCLQVQWLTGATRVRVGGQPALLSSSQGLCVGAGPPSPPNIVTTQTRVTGQ